MNRMIRNRQIFFNRKQKQTEKPDYKTEILDLIRSRKSPGVLAEELKSYHENDLAAVLPVMEKRERENLYRIMESEDLAAVLEYAKDAETYLDEMDIRKAAQLLQEMEPDTAVDVLRMVEQKKQKVLLDLMEEESRQRLRLLASYEEDRIASRMTTNFVAVSNTCSIKEAMHTVIEQAAEHDNISVIYVTDGRGSYYGAVSLKDLIIARKEQNMEEIAITAYPYVYADEEIDACLEMLKTYSEDSIPVLSDTNQILGVITAQDMIEVVDDELGEDYARLGGLTAEEDLKEPVVQSMKKRLPWLVLLLGLGLIVSGVVGAFEGVVAQLPLIISFQSLILDMAGNTGTQSLAVTIRVLMDENLTGKQKVLLIWKEVRIGFANGIILGMLAFAGVGIYICMAKGMSLQGAFAVSLCIGIALLLAMAVSSLVGTAVPMLFKQLGVDPAVASGPLITTVNDLVAVVTYYGLTWILLIEVLHLV
ncbi:MAG: magnesium transporter [Marvinbryantia sp.]